VSAYAIAEVEVAMNHIRRPKTGMDACSGEHLQKAPPDRERALAALDQAQRNLAETTNVREVKELRGIAETTRKHFRSTAKSLDLQSQSSDQEIAAVRAQAADALAIQNRAAEVKLRAERRLGQLLGDAHLHGGDRRSSSHDVTLKLRSWGISKQESHRCQLVASVPDAVFEEYVQHCGKSQKEMTTSALIRMARRGKEDHAHADSIEEGPSGLAEIAARLAELVRDGRQFPCIFVKPPWPAWEERPAGAGCRPEDRTAAFTRRLAQLPLAALATANAHVHLWSPPERLSSAITLLRSWGFTYRSVFVACRKPSAYCPYWRPACDFLVLGVRGHLPFRDSALLNWAETAGRQPLDGLESLLELLERVTPGPYLGLFVRLRKKPWTVLP